MLKKLWKGGIALLLLLLAVVLAGCAGPTGGDAGWSAFASDGERVYLGQPTGKFTAVDATGKKLWEFPSGKERLGGFYAAPILVGDQVIFAASDGSDPSGRRARVYSVTAATGGESRVLKETQGLIVGTPVLHGDTLYVTSADKHVYALDLATGQERWPAFGADGPIWGSVVPDGDRLYFGTMGHSVYAISASDGRLLWHHGVNGAVPGTPAVGQGLVFVGDVDSKLYALDAETGAEVWRFTEARNWIWGEPALVGDLLYVPSLDGNVYVLEARTGVEHEEWRIKTGGGVRAGPTLVGDVLYVASEDQSLYAVNVSTHKLAWTPYKAKGQLLTSPVVVGDTVYVTAANGTAFAVDARTGSGRQLYPEPK
ncbi:MAG: PQQ-binding-like beta-propeller repeat protein [Anaerolineae bacterium]|nr:PQQ-binding-like beta-propeller repeat protein [Anaerolineae bacterium]